MHNILVSSHLFAKFAKVLGLEIFSVYSITWDISAVNISILCSSSTSSNTSGLVLCFSCRSSNSCTERGREGGRERGREGGRERGREGERERGREGGRRGKEGGRGRRGEREREREGEGERGREGGREEGEGGRERN